MKNIKKLAAIVLAIVMCFSVFAVSAATVEESKKVELLAHYNEDATQVVISVVTKEVMGAIKGTFTAFKGNEALAINDADITLLDEGEGVEKASQFNVVDNAVTFVLVTNDTSASGGEKNWAQFKFAIDNSAAADYKFELTNIQVCTLGESLEEDGSYAKPANVTISAHAVKALGAKYRAASGSIAEGLRFATRLDRVLAEKNKIITKENATGNAVYCGYFYGFESLLKELNGTGWDGEIKATVDADDANPIVSTYCKFYEAKQCVKSEAEFLVYAFALTGYAGNTETEAAKDDNCIFRPYVVYKDANGEYAMELGQQMVISYNDAKAAADVIVGQ